MNNINYQIIFLSIVLAVSILLASGNEPIKSKVVKSQCTVHDTTTLQNASCWAKSINRTYSVANVRANITRVLDQLTINIKLFKRTEVKYRPFLVDVNEDYCAFFARNKAGIYLRIIAAMYLPYSNLNHTCPYYGEVIIKDAPLSMDSFPALWPPGEYLLEITAINQGRKIITMGFFFEFYDTITNKRNRSEVE